MPPPPAKRQKRLVHDSEEKASTVPEPHHSKFQVANTPASRTRSRLTRKDGSDENASTNRGRIKDKFAHTEAHSDSTPWSPPSSPERPSSKPKRTQKGHSKGYLHTSFNPTDQVPRAPTEPKPNTLQPQAEEVEEQEDVIEDDSPNDKIHKLPNSQKSTRLVLDRRKPLHEQAQNKAVTASQKKSIPASQRFLVVDKQAVKEASTQTRYVPKELDSRPWAAKYEPKSLDELMVHKKKVADVRGWLEGVCSGQERKV